MGELRRVGDLQIDQDPAFQRRMWAAQRAGWLVMALVILGGLLGAFGGRGLLARSQVGTDGDPLWMEYRRLARHGAPDALTLHVGPGLAEPRDSTLGVWFDSSYLRGLEIQQ